MADSSTTSGTGAGIDLSQFYQVFFEEAGENLENMEQQLLQINIEAADDEELNSIFPVHTLSRAVLQHSASRTSPN